MSIRRTATLTLASFVITILSSPAHANGWIQHPRVDAVNTGFDKIAAWINSDCKPDNMASVKFLYYQYGPSRDYVVDAFCYKGTGKLGRVTWAQWLYPSGSFNYSAFVSSVLEGPDIAVALVYLGQTNGIYYFKGTGR